MAWGTLRKATEEDYEKLNKAGRRFADRHANEIEYYDIWAEGQPSIYRAVDSAVYANLDAHGDPNDWGHTTALHIKNLWLRIVRRALGEPDADGIANGYVGYTAE